MQENGDEYHGEVLVKAGSEVDQGRDLNATITVGGMRCRLVLLDRAQAWVQLLPPVNLDQLKARDADFRYSGVVMRAHHKGTTFSNLRWKDRGTQLVDGEDAKVPKQAIIRLILNKANIMAKLPRAEERPAKRRAVEAEPEDTEGEPDVEMSDKSAEEPDVEMKPADEDLESTAASSSGVELWELALGGSTARFSVDRVTGFSPLGRERLITPVKEDLEAFKAFRHQGLHEVPNEQFLLSARLWNESVTKVSSPTVSATASEAPAEAAPEAAPEAPAEAAPEAPAEEASEAASEAPAEAPAEEARTYPSDEVERGGLAGFEMDGEGNFQLKASTLQEYREALPILQERMADGSVDKCSLMTGVIKGKEKWNSEKQPYKITQNDKLMLPKAKKSVAPEDAIVEIHWA